MSELPRLLFCCFDVVPAPHATSRRISEYLKGLVERYQTVVLSVKTPDHSHIERYHGARLLRVPVGSGDLRTRMEAFDRAVRRQLESEEYLVVHFFDPVSGYPLCERRGDFGYKLVYDACRFPSGDLPSLLPQEGANKRLLARSRRQELFCLMNADAVIVGSEAAKAHCVSLGVPAERLNVVRAPVDLAPYSPSIMGQPDGQPARLIHLGSHGRHQDLPVLFEALAKTTAQVKLALVGPSSPELTPPLKERVTELGLGERVEFQDPVAHDDIHKVLAACDIGMLTLGNEPRNSATTALARIGEFLAAGRPIIAAETPLTREIVPADAARFYPPGDVTALAAAIDALAADPALRRTMGAAARAATTAIDTQLVRDRLVAIYERVAPHGRAPVDGHVDAVDPAEATQLGGRPPDELGDVTQAGVPLPSLGSGVQESGTNKVKTDPALQAPTPEADTGTDQALNRERPPVMGVLLRDDRPPVPPESTDPAVQPQREPPVVMGLPVTDRLPDADAVEPPAPRPAPPVFEAEEPRSPTDPSLTPVPAKSPPAPVAAQAPAPSPEPAPPPPAITAPTSPGSVLLAQDDEPLDLSALLKPSAPPRVPVPAPEITAPNPPGPAARPAPPVPIQVPTSFSLANRPLPGATFVPVPVGIPVSTTPARMPIAVPTAPTAPTAGPAGPPPAPPPAPPRSAPAPQATADASTSGIRPLPPIVGAASSPSGARPVPAVVPAPDAPPAARPPPLVGAASSPSNARAVPIGATTEPIRPPPLVGAASAPSGARAVPAAAVPGPGSPPSAAGSPAIAAVPTSTVRPPPPTELPPLVRLVPSGTGAPVLSRADATHEDVQEVQDDEVELVADDSVSSLHDADDEIESHVEALETSAAPPPSRLDPWFAQLVHGYCPPESQLFTRHVPPTTMPGRDT